MVEFKSFFKEAGGNEGNRCHYATRLDTYGCGCEHNRAYCYARSLLDFRGLWKPDAPAVADITKIRELVGKLRSGSVVRLGGMTDCFQPIEKRLGVTRETIKALNARGVRYLIVTKSALIEEYLDVLDPELAHVQISITSTDAKISKRIEPGASLPAARIHAVEKLTGAGIDTAVRLSPFVPEFVDLDALAEIKCDKLLVEFLRVNTFIERWLAGSADLSLYTYPHAGYKHLPLWAKRDLLEKIHGFSEVSVCEDVPSHWGWWHTCQNPNPDDCCNLR